MNILSFSLVILTLSAPLYSMENTPKRAQKRPLTPTPTHMDATAAYMPEQGAAVKKQTRDDSSLRFTTLQQHNHAATNIAQSISLRKDGKMVGRIKFTYNTNTRYGYIEDLDVEHQWRHNGFGKLLMQKALNDLETWGCIEVGLCAQPDEEIYLHKLIAFYTHFDFRHDDDSPVNTEEDGAIIMKKIMHPATHSIQ